MALKATFLKVAKVSVMLSGSNAQMGVYQATSILDCREKSTPNPYFTLSKKQENKLL